MPWCPRCDEIFPDGNACPRCRARLEPADAGRAGHGLQPVEELPQLKVPRRYRRAFDRLSAPRSQPVRLLVVAGACLVFAVGFVLGRMGGVVPSGPTVASMAPVHALTTLDVGGSAAYLVWSAGDQLATIASDDVYSGDVTPRARLSSPTTQFGDTTRLAALAGSVALVVSGDDGSHIAVAPEKGPPFGWLVGVEAAWESRSSLLVKRADGSVVRWSADRSSNADVIDGTWIHVLQTASGAVLQAPDHLEVRAARGSRSGIGLPSGSDVLAASPDGTHALIVAGGLELWDGRDATRIRIDGYEPKGASFTASGDHVAIALRATDGSAAVAVVDTKGNAALKPVPARVGDCAPTPSWDSNARWIYVAVGDGSIYAVEAAGGRVEGVAVRAVGCGVAWTP